MTYYKSILVNAFNGGLLTVEQFRAIAKNNNKLRERKDLKVKRFPIALLRMSDERKRKMATFKNLEDEIALSLDENIMLFEPFHGLNLSDKEEGDTTEGFGGLTLFTDIEKGIFCCGNFFLDLKDQSNPELDQQYAFHVMPAYTLIETFKPMQSLDLNRECISLLRPNEGNNHNLKTFYMYLRGGAFEGRGKFDKLKKQVEDMIPNFNDNDYDYCCLSQFVHVVNVGGVTYVGIFDDEDEFFILSCCMSFLKPAEELSKINFRFLHMFLDQSLMQKSITFVSKRLGCDNGTMYRHKEIDMQFINVIRRISKLIKFYRDEGKNEEIEQFINPVLRRFKSVKSIGVRDLFTYSEEKKHINEKAAKQMILKYGVRAEDIGKQAMSELMPVAGTFLYANSFNEKVMFGAEDLLGSNIGDWQTVADNILMEDGRRFKIKTSK